MSYFQAEYFDGKSSKKHSARVFVDELNNRLAIEFGGPADEYWPLPGITVAHTGNHTEIKDPSQPGKSLHVFDAVFRKELRRVLDKKHYSGWYQKLIYAGTGAHILLALSILGLIVAAYLWVLPAVAEKAVELLPESYDQSMGSSFYDNFIQYETIDSAKTELVKQFAQELKFGKTRNYSFTVVKSKEVNAFALPDGSIIIFTGILDHMENYTELVALLSHESAHVDNRHSMKLLCRNLSGYLFLSVVLSDVNGIMAVIADNANTLRSLSYSRGFEKEADMEGIETMARNEVDPNGMVQLFEQLKKEHSSSLPGFVSTHPLTDERIRYITEKISSGHYTINKNARLEEIFRRIK